MSVAGRDLASAKQLHLHLTPYVLAYLQWNAHRARTRPIQKGVGGHIPLARNGHAQTRFALNGIPDGFMTEAATSAMRAPSITVITVCRNPGVLLRRAISSVARLADPRVRHIVIDGASTDGTVEYLQTSGGRLHCWTSEPDHGIYDAMNKGWMAAPEESYVLFLGADDQLLSLPSSREIVEAEEHGTGIIFGTTDIGGIRFRSRWDRGIRFRNTVHHQSMLVHKRLSPTAPFDARYRVYGDWDFNLRLWHRGVKAAFSPALTALADPGGASSTRPLLETFQIGNRNGGAWAGIVAVGVVAYCGLRNRLSGSRSAP